ncbi:MAG: WD40 repeat domain-containing protein, partial [Nannocystaceae bacterium]
DGGKSLVVAYRHGDVITWNTANGKQRKHVPGTCSVEEATTVVNMYNTRDMPQKNPSAEERKMCGRANTGRLSRDASLLVTAGTGLRIRDRAGAARAMIVRGDGTLIPDDMLEFASDKTLALVNLYGRPEFWRGGNKLEKMFAKEAQTGPTTPEVTNHGQYLEFELGRETFIWDLQTGEKVATKLAAKETLAAISPDANLAVVRTAEGAGELRNLKDQVTTTSWPNLGNMVAARFSHAGTHVVVDRGYEAERRMLLRNLETGTEVELATPIVGEMPLVSDRGETLVSADPRNNHIQIWNPTTGALAQTVDAPDLRAAALAPDGSFVVWVSAAQDPQVTVNYLALKGQATPLPLVVEGWPKRECLTISPDSSEVFICTERALARWYPGEGRHATTPKEFVTADRVSYSATGDLLFLGSYGRVDLHRNTPKLEEVGTVYPRLDGGWLAMSRAGAVDGSKHAHASLVTFVVGLDRWIDDGILAWDRFATPGLYPRMLAGEDVQPPVPALPPEAVRPQEN